MSEKALVTNVVVKTADAIAPLRDLATTSHGTDDAMAAMADSTANAVETLTKSIGKAAEKLASTGSVSQAAFDKLAVGAGQLRDDVIKQFGAMENAPVEFQNAVAAVNGTLSQ